MNRPALYRSHADKFFREAFGDPTASDLRTLRAVGGFTIGEISEITGTNRRTVERQIAGGKPVSTAEFAALVGAFSRRSGKLSRDLCEELGPQWWRRPISIEVGDDGTRRFFVM